MTQQRAKSMKQRRRYPADLADAQWAIVEAAMPPAVNGRTGGPPRCPRRELWSAIFYQAKHGGTWRALPHGFPVWPQDRRWRDNGTLAAVQHEAQRLRDDDGQQRRLDLHVDDPPHAPTPRRLTAPFTASSRATSV